MLLDGNRVNVWSTHRFSFSPHLWAAWSPQQEVFRVKPSLWSQLLSVAARQSVVSLLHVGQVVLQPRPNRLVHRQLQGHLFEHFAHRRLQTHEGGVYCGMESSDIPSRRLNRSSYLLEVEFLEHADADLVVQADFHLKPFHPEFSDPWWKQTLIFSVEQQLSAWLVFHLTLLPGTTSRMFRACAHRNTSSSLSPLSRCLCLCSWALLQARNFVSGTDETSESYSGQTLSITCYHDLQLSQGRLRGVSQENVDISHHALLLFHTAVSPPMLVQDDERTLWKHGIKKTETFL